MSSQRLTYWGLVHQLVALLGGSEIFRRWGLVEGSEVFGFLKFLFIYSLWCKAWNPGPCVC
jgi:hypothetical protein